MMSLISSQYSMRMTGPLRRLLILAGLSVLAHAIVLHWAAGNPDLAWPAPSPDAVITADIVPLPVATPAIPSVPRPAPKKKHRHTRATRPVVPTTPAPALQQGNAISSGIVSAPEDDSAELVKKETAPQKAAADTPAPDQTPAVPVEDKSPSTPASKYKIDPPPSVDLHYAVTKTSANGGSMSGRGKISWHRENGSYAITGEVSWLFITALKFNSEGMLDEYGVSPVLYSQKSFRRSATNTHFQRERNVVSFSASENSYPRAGGEQDRASIIWQLASMGHADEGQFLPGKEFEIMVAGVRDEEPWQLRVIGKEDISVGIGSVEAWHLVRTPKPGSYDQTLDIWLSPAHDWYPVKLRYTEPNGDHLDLDLSKMSAPAPN